MASINDHTIANERVHQQALLVIASHLDMDEELMKAIACTGPYLKEIVYSHDANRLIRKGSPLERVITNRLYGGAE